MIAIRGGLVLPFAIVLLAAGAVDLASPSSPPQVSSLPPVAPPVVTMAHPACEFHGDENEFRCSKGAGAIILTANGSRLVITGPMMMRFGKLP